MNDEQLASLFEQHRSHLQAIAYRMLGSLSEAEDAVQDTWLRLSRSGADDVENLGGWLTTIVARVCLNMLRSRNVRREESLEVHLPDPVITSADTTAQPEEAVLLADEIGLAMLVVLDTLTADERLAFVLHDMFDLPYGDLARIVDRTPQAARQLASRARRRVKDAEIPIADTDLTRQRKAVNAFLAAARHGDFDGLVAVLHPDVLLRTDTGVLKSPVPVFIRGSEGVAAQAAKGFNQLINHPASQLHPVLVNGSPGALLFTNGQPTILLSFTVSKGAIAQIDALADPKRLRELTVSALAAGTT